MTPTAHCNKVMDRVRVRWEVGDSPCQSGWTQCRSWSLQVPWTLQSRTELSTRNAFLDIHRSYFCQIDRIHFVKIFHLFSAVYEFCISEINNFYVRFMFFWADDIFRLKLYKLVWYYNLFLNKTRMWGNSYFVYNKLNTHIAYFAALISYLVIELNFQMQWERNFTVLNINCQLL